MSKDSKSSDAGASKLEELHLLQQVVGIMNQKEYAELKEEKNRLLEELSYKNAIYVTGFGGTPVFAFGSLDDAEIDIRFVECRDPDHPELQPIPFFSVRRTISLERNLHDIRAPRMDCMKEYEIRMGVNNGALVLYQVAEKDNDIFIKRLDNDWVAHNIYFSNYCNWLSIRYNHRPLNLQDIPRRQLLEYVYNDDNRNNHVYLTHNDVHFKSFTFDELVNEERMRSDDGFRAMAHKFANYTLTDGQKVQVQLLQHYGVLDENEIPEQNLIVEAVDVEGEEDVNVETTEAAETNFDAAGDDVDEEKEESDDTESVTNTSSSEVHVVTKNEEGSDSK